MDISVRKAYRSGNVIGFEVRSPKQERIGEIEEVVLDVENGRIAYAVLSFGGLFGFGDKFFAVPWEEFHLKHGEGESHFELDTDREKLQALPGFDKKDWPDVATTDWDVVVDAHYQKGKARPTEAGS